MKTANDVELHWLSSPPTLFLLGLNEESALGYSVRWHEFLRSAFASSAPLKSMTTTTSRYDLLLRVPSLPARGNRTRYR